MKKLLSVLLLSAGLSCAPAHHASSNVPATVEDCQRGYSRILSLKLRENLEPDYQYSAEEIRTGIRTLDGEYESRGTKAAFLKTCQTKYDREQISCMMESVSLEGMSLCALVKEKK